MEHMYIQTQMCVATNIPIIIIAKSPTIAQSLLSKSWHNVIPLSSPTTFDLILQKRFEAEKKIGRGANKGGKIGKLPSLNPFPASLSTTHTHCRTMMMRRRSRA